MNENYVICPSCGAYHYNVNLIICPQCGAEMHANELCDKSEIKYNIVTAYISMFRKFSDFKGRSRRSEYWYAYLANFIITFCLLGAMLAINFFAVKNADADGNFPDGCINAFNIINGIFYVYSIVVFVPQLALIVRRLHDTGKSTAYVVFLLLPPLGTFILMAIMALDSYPGPNRYGVCPKNLCNQNIKNQR